MPERRPGSQMGGGDASRGLRILMLGPFECWRGAERVAREAWRTRQTLTLFKLLLDQRDRAVPVEHLTDVIWPDSDPAAARRSLAVAVRTLRLALEPNLGRGVDSRFVRTEPGAYRFDASDCTLDVELFLAANQRALSDRGRHDPVATIAACDEAIALYRGEYLVDDPYSEWTFSTREHLRSHCLDVLDELSATLAATGRWEQAIAWLDRALDLDPLREELYRRLMRCHLASGRRSHALTAYERCRSTLKRELGIEPSDATRALHAEILRQRSTAPVGPMPPSVGVRRAGDLRLPFVGRDTDLLTLRRAWERARNDPGILAAVSGPPGIGKTRLAQEFAGQLEPEPGSHAATGHGLVWLHCHEAERNLPFAPLVRLLATWLERAPSVGERRRLEPFAPALMRLVPQAEALLTDEREIGAAFEPIQLLEGLTQAVLLASRSASAVLVVDDLQWADASTLLWLSYALQRLDAGTLTIVTYRTAEAATPEMDQLLAEARRGGRLIDLRLPPLGIGALDTLIAGGLHDGDRRIALSRWLHRTTGGLPLYVVAMLRDLASTGRLYADESGWWRIERLGDPTSMDIGPPGTTLRETIQARVNRLEPDVVTTFRVLCVVAAECRAPLLSAATGATLEATLAALDTLLEHELVRVSSDGRGYAVEHPVVQEVVYGVLSAAKRQELHRRIARALRDLTGAYPLPAGQVLHHLIAGDAPLPEIIEGAELAGEQAMQQAAVSDALEFFELAIEHLRRLLPTSEAQTRLIKMSERRADTLATMGQWDEAIAAYAELQVAGTDALSRSRVMRKHASVLGDVRGQFARALHLLADAERELLSAAGSDPQLAEIEHGRVEAARSNAYFFQSAFNRAIEHGELALASWTGKSGVERDEIEQIMRLGFAWQRLGRLDDAEARYRTAIARASLFGDRVLLARIRDNLGALLSLRGRLAEAQRMHEETARTGAELGVPRLELSGLTNTANALSLRGQLLQAHAVYERALERAEALDAKYTVMHVLVGLGEVLVRSGESATARQTLQRGIQLSEAISSVQRRGHAYLHLAELALLEGDAADAVSWAERGLATGAEIGDLHAKREGLPLLALAYLHLGRVEEAERVARDGLEVATTGGFRVSEGRNLLALGEVLTAADRMSGAERLLRRSESIFRDADDNYDLARTLLARAHVVQAGEARCALLLEARELAGNIAARPLTNLANEALGAIQQA